MPSDDNNSGGNFSPFVSPAILQTVKDIFSLSPDNIDNRLGLGTTKV